MGVFDPSDGFDNFGEPRLQLVQELEEVLRQLGHEADGAADRAEEDGASVRDAGVRGVNEISRHFPDILPGVAEVLHDEAAVLEHVDVVADVDLADLRHLLPLLVRARPALAVTHEHVHEVLGANKPVDRNYY